MPQQFNYPGMLREDGPEYSYEMLDEIDRHHRLTYRAGVHERVTWKGYPVVKTPQELLNYQEVIYETKPNIIIETGTFLGGSAIFFADMMDVLVRTDHKVITIDPYTIEHRKNWANGHPGFKFWEHHSVEWIYGPSDTKYTRDHILKVWGRELTPRRGYEPRIMVVLDAQHEAEFVARELELWANLVTPGCYLVIEDTNINGHPITPADAPDAQARTSLEGITALKGGPMEGLGEYIKSVGESEYVAMWEPDFARYRKFLFSANTWLKRK